MLGLLLIALPILLCLGLATVAQVRYTGSGPTISSDYTSGQNSRLNAYDTDSTADTTNPIQIPASGTNYSYGGWFRLHCSVAPATGISNVRWYGPNSNPFVDPTTISLSAGTKSTYSQSTGTPGTTGNLITSPTMNTCFTTGYIAASPLSLPTTSGPPFTGTGYVCDFLVLQISVLSTCTSTGAINTASSTYVWDES